MLETSVRFSFPTSHCRIIAGTGSFGSMAGIVDSLDPSSVFVITDDRVYHHHRKRLEMAADAISAKSSLLILPAGERTKSVTHQISVHKWLLENCADRSSLLVGVGGGVVCDIVGFAAATFMRGIGHIFVPTTG